MGVVGCIQGMATTTVAVLVAGGLHVESGDFAEWVRPHLLPMTRLATRLAGDAADDVVQEALVRAWRRQGTYDADRGEPLPWLLAITADRARRHRSRARVHEPLVDRADDSARAVDGRIELESAIKRLPRKQRLAVELHYFVGLNVREVAEALGCADGTVKSQLSDARARLRRELGEA
jgi:RNA polymerase sigma factor (sigma-70 family)